jgi:heme exporter protein CcmD
MDAATHTGFIIAAYAAAIAIVGGLTAWVMVDYRLQLRSLADLDRKGVARRGGPTTNQAREDA